MIAQLLLLAGVSLASAVKCKPSNNFLVLGNVNGSHTTKGRFDGVFNYAHDHNADIYVEFVEGLMFSYYNRDDFKAKASWRITDKGPCEKTDLTQPSEEPWAWLEEARSVGHRLVNGRTVEVFAYEHDGIFRAIGCSDADASVPIYLAYRRPEYQMEIRVLNWIPEAPGERWFQLPRECHAAETAAVHKL